MAKKQGTGAAKAGTKTRIYRCVDVENRVTRLVNAGSQSQALRHVAQNQWQISRASSGEVAKAFQTGEVTAVENAKEEPGESA